MQVSVITEKLQDIKKAFPIDFGKAFFISLIT